MAAYTILSKPRPRFDFLNKVVLITGGSRGLGLVLARPLAGMGAAFGKGLTFKMGQTNMHKYMPKLLAHIENGDIDPSFVRIV